MATRDVPMSSDNECYVNATCKNTFGDHTCNCSEGCQGDGKKMCEELPGSSTLRLHLLLLICIALFVLIVPRTRLTVCSMTLTMEADEPRAGTIGESTTPKQQTLSRLTALQNFYTSHSRLHLMIDVATHSLTCNFLERHTDRGF